MTVTVVLKGSPEEIGCQRAKALRSSILLSMEHLLVGHGRETSACVDWGRQRQADVKARFPALMEEIVAVSRELGVDQDLVFAYNYRAWNAATPHPSHPQACYNIFFRDKARGPLLGGVVEDSPPFYVLEEIHPRQGIPHYTVTLAGTCWTARGFNAEGLAVGQVSAFPGEGVLHVPLAGSLLRQQVVLQQARKQKPGLALMRRILTAHEDGEGAFCNYNNQVNTIAVPQAGKFLVSGYLCCRSGFTEYRF